MGWNEQAFVLVDWSLAFKKGQYPWALEKDTEKSCLPIMAFKMSKIVSLAKNK